MIHTIKCNKHIKILCCCFFFSVPCCNQFSVWDLNIWINHFNFSEKQLTWIRCDRKRHHLHQSDDWKMNKKKLSVFWNGITALLWRQSKKNVIETRAKACESKMSASKVNWNYPKRYFGMRFRHIFLKVAHNWFNESSKKCRSKTHVRLPLTIKIPHFCVSINFSVDFLETP